METVAESDALAKIHMKPSSSRRKLDDFLRQFGLGQPDLDRLTDYLADQVWNRHARSIGRPSKTAHPFLVERIEWNPAKRNFTTFGRVLMCFFLALFLFRVCRQSSRKLSRYWARIGVLGVQHLKRGN